MENTYQGYKNRSTWLAKLHLDNTNPEVSTRATEIAIQANTTKQFKAMITPLLADIKALGEEVDFDVTKIDMAELWDAMEK